MTTLVKVLFDHNMPPCIARALHELIKKDGHQAEPLRDKFAMSVPDIEYFSNLDRNWIVISKDLKNARKKAERAAILKNKIVAFYLSPSLQKKNVGQQAASILWHWESMLITRSTHENGLLQLSENKSKFKSL